MRPGDSALVLADGVIDGVVGGVCAQSSVRLHAARALETGEAVILRLEPGAGEETVEDGIVVDHNPCLSGGTMEIFLEPQLPALRIATTDPQRSMRDKARGSTHGRGHASPAS